MFICGVNWFIGCVAVILKSSSRFSDRMHPKTRKMHIYLRSESIQKRDLSNTGLIYREIEKNSGNRYSFLTLSYRERLASSRHAGGTIRTRPTLAQSINKARTLSCNILK